MKSVFLNATSKKITNTQIYLWEFLIGDRLTFRKMAVRLWLYHFANRGHAAEFRSNDAGA